jgi:hypothetical protein
MSLFGSLRTTLSTPAVPTNRLATLPDANSGEDRGNGGNKFLSLVANAKAGEASGGQWLPIRSALSSQAAYQASLIGSMLNQATDGLQPTRSDGGGQTADGGGDQTPLSGELIAGVADAGFAAMSNGIANLSSLGDDQDNSLPPVTGEDPSSPIGDPNEAVTNALPRMDAPPA